MSLLLAFLLIAAQEPSTAELIRRLDSEKFQVREDAQAALQARGAAALKEVEAALAASAPGELRIRLGRLIRPLRLAELTERVPAQFSETFRVAAGELIERLKKPDPAVLIEAVAATCGRATHWETEEKPGSHGTHKVQRQITREIMKGATRADGAEVILLALRALPEKPLDERWQAVYGSARYAIRPEEVEHRRRLCWELQTLRSEEDIPRLILSIVSRSRDADDIPFLLTAFDDPDPQIARYAISVTGGINPGRHVDLIVKSLPKFKPAHRATLLRTLQNVQDKSLLPLFLELVDAPEPEVRSAAFNAAAAKDPESLTDIVMRRLKSGKDEEVVFGLQMAFRLKSMGKPPRVEFVREAGRIFMTSKDEKAQGAAFNLMVWAQGEGCTEEQVIRALSHPTAGVRRHALSLLGKSPGPDVIAALKKLPDDPDDEVAAFATITLIGMKHPCPLDRMRALMTKPCSTNAKSQAMRCLVESLGKEARKDIAPLLECEDTVIQIMALQNFGTLGAEGFEDKIRPLLDSKKHNLAMWAVRALVPTGDKSCWPAIKKGLAGAFWDYVPSAAHLAYPEKAKAMQAVSLKVPDEGTTVSGLLEDLRTSLTPLGITLKIVLSAETLAAPVKRGAFQGKTVFWFYWWQPDLIQDAFWFFDGETLSVMRRQEAKVLWVDWAKSK